MGLASSLQLPVTETLKVNIDQYNADTVYIQTLQSLSLQHAPANSLLSELKALFTTKILCSASANTKINQLSQQIHSKILSSLLISLIWIDSNSFSPF